MAGMKVVVVGCDREGNVDLATSARRPTSTRRTSPR
jgi:glycine cleavage system protein P-like pyridoxal-binding family